MYKICFLGTPEFAAEHLRALLQESKFQVVGVVTQPDRPKGRKMVLSPSPVKEIALQFKIPVVTPENLRKEPEIFEVIKSWGADTAVVVAFGQILSQEFLDSFTHGAVNIHGSLLPKWRGAAPIQRSLEAGDQVTGVTLQKMVKKLDAGPIIAERKIQVKDDTTSIDLYQMMSQLGQDMLKNEFIKYLEGELKPKEQDETQVTFAPKIEKSEAQLNFHLTAQDFHNKVRAFNTGPGTFVIYKEQRLKIHKTKVITPEKIKELGLFHAHLERAQAGQILYVSGSELIVKLKDTALEILEVQPESKAKMVVKDFLNSQHLKVGDLL